MLLSVAGNGITQNTISHTMKALQDFPDQRELLLADVEGRIASDEFVRVRRHTVTEPAVGFSGGGPHCAEAVTMASFKDEHGLLRYVGGVLEGPGRRHPGREAGRYGGDAQGGDERARRGAGVDLPARRIGLGTEDDSAHAMCMTSAIANRSGRAR